MKVLILTMWFAAFSSFGWGMLRFFRTPAGLTWQTGPVALVGLAFSVLHLFALATVAPRPVTAGVAVLLYASSIGLFWSAALCHQQRPTAIFQAEVPAQLVVRGPYRCIRHPFYTSYTIFWAAGWVASGSPIVLLSAIVMLAIYVWGARLEEVAFASSALAGEYAAYRQRAGLFLPRFRRSRTSSTFTSRALGLSGNKCAVLAAEAPGSQGARRKHAGSM